MTRLRMGWLTAVFVALSWPAIGGAGDVPQLIITAEPGERGEVVAVQVALSGDSGEAVTADLDIAFPDDLVAFVLPIKDHCVLAPRLAATHQVAGTLVSDGLVQVAILDPAAPLAPLGDGLLVTCELEILASADRSPALLAADFASLGDARGQLLDVDAADGAVGITDLPQPCLADCDGDGEVTVNEAVRAVAIALGAQPLANCPVADGNGDGQVRIEELIDAVKDVISGC